MSGFPGRPCRIFSSTSVNRLISDVRTGKLLGPVVIHDGTSNRCRLVSNRHEGETCRVLNLSGVGSMVMSISSGRTIVLVISDGYRESGVLPDRGTFSCGVGLRTVGDRNGQASLASPRIITGLEDSRLVKGRTGRDGRAMEQFVELACLMPRLLRFISDNEVGVRPTVRLSCLSRRYRESLISVVSSASIFPSFSRAIEVEGTFGGKRLACRLVTGVVTRSGTGRGPQCQFSIRGLGLCLPSGLGSGRTRRCMVGTLGRCGGCVREGLGGRGMWGGEVRALRRDGRFGCFGALKLLRHDTFICHACCGVILLRCFVIREFFIGGCRDGGFRLVDHGCATHDMRLSLFLSTIKSGYVCVANGFGLWGYAFQAGGSAR